MHRVQPAASVLQQLPAHESFNIAATSARVQSSARICCVLGEVGNARGPLFLFGASLAGHQLEGALPCGLGRQPKLFYSGFDQCRTGLCCPETLQPIQKRTRLLSNAPDIRDVFEPLQCQCQEPHKRLAGSVNGVPLSVMCQEYTPELCEKLAQAVLATVS